MNISQRCMKTYISYLCIAAQRDIIRRYVNEGRAILYEYTKTETRQKLTAATYTQFTQKNDICGCLLENLISVRCNHPIF